MTQEQRSIGKNTLRVLGAMEHVDSALSRITFPIWKRVLALRGVEMYKVDSLGEQQVLNRRISAMLEDATEIRIAEGDLSEGLLSEREWLPDSRIKITKVPRGEAPKEIRQHWRGVEMDAFKLPASEENVEVGLVSGERIHWQKVNCIK